MRRILALLLFCGVAVIGRSQIVAGQVPDTIRLNSGKIIIGHVLDTTGRNVKYSKANSKKNKKKGIDRYDVYQITFGNNKRVIFNILDTVLLNSGKIVITHVTDTLGFSVQMVRPHSHKHKKMDIDKDNIFQITFGNSGKQVVFYFYDTLIGNDMTVDEARRFIAGEQDAEHGYRALWTSMGAFGLGAASGIVLGSFFAFAPPVGFAGFMTYNYVKIRHKSVRNIENVHHDTYLLGYALVARRKRTMRSMLWGGIGAVVGTIIHYVIINNQP